MEKALKKYDKFLKIKRDLDGRKTILRISPFNSIKEFEVFNIENQYIGSSNWVLKKLSLMDTQKFAIIESVKQKNLKIQQNKGDSRVHKEISEFLFNNEQIII